MSLSSPVQNLAIHLILSVVGFCFCSYYCFFARSLKLHRRLCCLDVLVSGLLVIGSNFTCMSGWRAICISAMCAFVQTMRVRNVHTWTGPGEIKMHMHWLWVMWMRRLSSFSSAFSLSLSLSSSAFVRALFSSWFDLCAPAQTLCAQVHPMCVVHVEIEVRMSMCLSADKQQSTYTRQTSGQLIATYKLHTCATIHMHSSTLGQSISVAVGGVNKIHSIRFFIWWPLVCPTRARRLVAYPSLYLF